LEEECKTPEVLFASIDLGFLEKALLSEYHEEGEPGRPPRNPLGIFKAQIVRRLMDIPSNRN
jgi:hypothetical protein